MKTAVGIDDYVRSFGERHNKVPTEILPAVVSEHYSDIRRLASTFPKKYSQSGRLS